MLIQYIFIVGLPRTGTKLIQNIIKKSIQVNFHTVGETVFMGGFLKSGFRSTIRKIGDLSNDKNVEKLVDFMYSNNSKINGDFWKKLRRNKTVEIKKIIIEKILHSKRTERDIYKILLEINVDKKKNTIVSDKTPSNLYYVPTLLKWFPEAKIVHTFRDPRAILASEWRKRTHRTPATYIPFKVDSPFYTYAIVLHVTLMWIRASKLHYKYKEKYPHNYYLSKFEDLITNPEVYVKELCNFLEIEFENDMLKPHHSDSSYPQTQNTMGFDKETLERWTFTLSPWMKLWLQVWCKKYLREFEYTYNKDIKIKT